MTLGVLALAVSGCVYIFDDLFGSKNVPFERIDTTNAYTHKNIEEAIFCVHIFNAADPLRAQRVGDMCDQIITKI